MSLELDEDEVELWVTHLDSKKALDCSSIEEVSSFSIASGISSCAGLNFHPDVSFLGKAKWYHNWNH